MLVLQFGAHVMYFIVGQWVTGGNPYPIGLSI